MLKLYDDALQLPRLVSVKYFIQFEIILLWFFVALQAPPQRNMKPAKGSKNNNKRGVR